MRKIFISILMICCFADFNRAYSQALYPVDINEKILHSSLIIEGRVVQQQSFWNPAHTMIFTSNTVSVYKAFKGTVQKTEVEIMTTGGTVGLESVEASDLLKLEKDEVGVFFCYPNSIKLSSPFTGNQLLDVYSAGQGAYSYDLNARTANAPFVRYASIVNDLYTELIKKTGHQPVIVNPAFNLSPQAKPLSPLAPAITGFSPQIANAGATLDPANNLLTITGSGFGAQGDSSAVFFDDANDGSGGTPYKVLASSDLVQSWTNNQITVRVPARAGSGLIQVRDSSSVTSSSPSPLTINYSVLTNTFSSNGNTVTKEINLMNTNGNGGYTTLYSTGTGGSGVNLNAAPEKTTFQRALNTWKEIAGYNITEGGTTTAQTVAGDAANIIMFDNMNTGVAPLAAGVLAVCYSFSNMCTPVLTNQAQRTGFDIVIRNQGVSTGSISFTSGPCAPADPYSDIDLETVLLHELGHSLNLAHVNDGAEGPPAPNRNPPKLMNYAISPGVSRKSPDYAAYTGALYCITPQSNAYGTCLAPSEMTPLSRITVAVDECPANFPTSPTPAGTSVSFDLVHATSNKFTDPAYNAIDCASPLGTSVTNNAYYPIRSNSDGGTLNIQVSGYASFPTTVQGNCAGAGIRVALFQVNSCPGGQNFPAPVACRTITRNGNLQAITGLAANTNYLVYVDGLDNTKGNFTLTFNGTVLPVTLLDFNGVLVSDKVNLAWKTTREINTKEFQVEKSFDGAAFTQFAVVTAKGDSASNNNYGTVDANPYSGFTFYRLKMIDKDGDFKYSPVVKINTPKKAVVVSRIFPNPASAKLNFQIIADTRQLLTLETFDLLGKKVANYKLPVEPGFNEKPVQVGTLAAGTYFIQVEDAAGNIVGKSKFIKN